MQIQLSEAITIAKLICISASLDSHDNYDPLQRRTRRA